MENGTQSLAIDLTLCTANFNIIMQVKNQIVVISGILALLATATIASSNIVQPANAAYGNDVIAPNAQTGTWGSQVSSAAQDDGSASTHQGLGDYRANGCKITEPRGTNPGGVC
jgi:hypothetical protein